MEVMVGRGELEGMGNGRKCMHMHMLKESANDM